MVFVAGHRLLLICVALATGVWRGHHCLVDNHRGLVSLRACACIFGHFALSTVFVLSQWFAVRWLHCCILVAVAAMTVITVRMQSMLPLARCRIVGAVAVCSGYLGSDACAVLVELMMCNLVVCTFGNGLAVLMTFFGTICLRLWVTAPFRATHHNHWHSF